MRFEMDRPAASSAALLMRLPVDNFSIALERSRLLTAIALAAISDLTLVLITDISFSFTLMSGYCVQRNFL